MRVLIAGCGDVGNVVAKALLKVGHTVFGLKRNISTLPRGVVGLSADLTDPSSLTGLPADIDRIVFMPTPSERTLEAYRSIYLQGWVNLRAAVQSPPQRSLIVSSTSVYGQSDGSWVKEGSPCLPAKFNGRVLLEMEALARGSAEVTMVARLSGIYGPGREGLLKSVATGQAVQASPPQFTNRIHRDDAGAALAHLLLLEKPDDLVLVSDDFPVAKYEVVTWLAAKMGFPPPPVSTNVGVGSGKRISNQRLRDSGLQLKYPNYQVGYTQILAQRNNYAVPG